MMSWGPLGRETSYRSWVSLEWAFPGVVVSIVVPFSVSVRNALELLISNIVVSVGIWVESVDTFFSGGENGWLVHLDGRCSSDESKEFHFDSKNYN